MNVEVAHARAIDPPGIAGPAGTSRIGVLVLGMHRSGTSALARMLNLLGCSLPRTVLGSNESNPLGHWESDEIIRLNDELLEMAGSTWDDWLPVGEGFFTAPGYTQQVARAAELLRSEYDTAPLFVLKDPRNCRLARFWLDVFDAEAIRPAVVIPMRNPLEVALSLKARNQADEHYGPLLWLRHVLDAEAASRGRMRVFTSYDQLLDSWEIVAARLQTGLGVAWPRMSPATQEEIGAFVDQRHRREHANPEAILGNPLVSGWVRRAFAILNTWTVAGENANDHAELDAISHAFAEATPAFARLILHGTQARSRVGELESQAAALQATAVRVGELEAALGQADIRAAEVEAHAAQQLASQAELVAENDLLAQNVAQALAVRDAMQARIDELTGWHEAAQAGAATLIARNSEIEWLLGESRAGTETATDQLRDAVDRLADHGRLIVEQANRLAEQDSALIQRREENEQIWTALAREQAATAELRGLLVASSQREEIQRQQLAEAYADAARLADEWQAARAELQVAWHAQSAAEQRKESAEAEAAQQIRDMSARLAEIQADSADMAALLAKRFNEIALLTELLRANEKRTQASEAEAQAERDKWALEADASRVRCAQLERELAERASEVARYTQAVSDRDGEAAAVKAQLDETQTRLEDRFTEITQLSRLYLGYERQAREFGEQTEWLRQFYAIKQRAPRWWSFLPQKWARKLEMKRLRRKGLFDGTTYLAQNPDVAAKGMDPLRHYILHGLAEGRKR